MNLSDGENGTSYIAPWDYGEIRNVNISEGDGIIPYWNSESVIVFTQYMSVVWYSVILVLGMIGNGLVIWIAGFKMKTVNATWFLNLAIADFVTSISLPLRIAEWVLYFRIPYDHFLCKSGITTLFINMLSSVCFMTVISVDRCVSIYCPVWMKIHRTRKKAAIVCALTWGFSLLASTPHIFYNHVLEDVSECYPKYVHFYEYTERKHRRAMFIIRNICMFSVPFTVISVSYILIFIKVRSVRKWKRSRRPSHIITAVVVSFFICWFPYNTWPLINVDEGYWKVDMIVTEISACMAYFSSCINPIIYVFICRDFKRNFIKSLLVIFERAFSERSDCECQELATTTCTNVRLNTSLL
ncbi:formyl peptide receptor-related sequence 4-like [Hyperolius riggenbachi]|uniref:formyl peptide receptor-related sequence 4-like n=1 Tax=Hyperolius riggenbachi TaxID=752182 RepID=UPI0035A3254F